MLEGPGDVGFWVDHFSPGERASRRTLTLPFRRSRGRSLSVFGSRLSVVRQFHHVIEIPAGLVATDVEDMDLAFGMGDRLEVLNPFKLAFERTVVVEGAPVHHLDSAVKAGRAPC